MASAKAMGAVQLTTSTYLLPDRPAQHEQFQWLAKEIRDSGGDATLVRAAEMKGMSREKVVALFNAVRDTDYAALKKTLQPLLKTKKADGMQPLLNWNARPTVSRSPRDRFLRKPARTRGGDVLLRLEQEPRRALPQLNRKDYRGKAWQTRPRPEIDRAGSAC